MRRSAAPSVTSSFPSLSMARPVALWRSATWAAHRWRGRAAAPRRAPVGDVRLAVRRERDADRVLQADPADDRVERAGRSDREHGLRTLVGHHQSAVGRDRHPPGSLNGAPPTSSEGDPPLGMSRTRPELPNQLPSSAFAMSPGAPAPRGGRPRHASASSAGASPASCGTASAPISAANADDDPRVELRAGAALELRDRLARPSSPRGRGARRSSRRRRRRRRRCARRAGSPRRRVRRGSRAPSQRSWLARTSAATGASAGAAARMRSPMIVCWRMKPTRASSSGPGLVEDRVGDRHLADVVQLGGAARSRRAPRVGRPSRAADGAARLGDARRGARAGRARARCRTLQQHVARLAAGRGGRLSLCAYMRLVGEPQRLLASAASPGSATRRRRRDVKPSPRSASAAAQRRRVVGVGGRGVEQEAELVAADAGRRARGADGRRELGRGGEQRVAGGVAEGVVVALEAVEVEEPRARLARRGRRQLAREVVHERAPVRQPGERVRARVTAGPQHRRLSKNDSAIRPTDSGDRGRARPQRERVDARKWSKTRTPEREHREHGGEDEHAGERARRRRRVAAARHAA